jgi:hypothetical protein
LKKKEMIQIMRMISKADGYSSKSTSNMYVYRHRNTMYDN